MTTVINKCCGAEATSPNLDCPVCVASTNARNIRQSRKRERIENLRAASTAAVRVLTEVGDDSERSDEITNTAIRFASLLEAEAASICVMREIEGIPLGETCPVCGKEDC